MLLCRGTVYRSSNETLCKILIKSLTQIAGPNGWIKDLGTPAIRKSVVKLGRTRLKCQCQLGRALLMIYEPIGFIIGERWAGPSLHRGAVLYLLRVMGRQFLSSPEHTWLTIANHKGASNQGVFLITKGRQGCTNNPVACSSSSLGRAGAGNQTAAQGEAAQGEDAQDIAAHGNPFSDGEATSKTQAVVWLKSLLGPGTFSPVFRCTAAVIGREFVLTSATCIGKSSKEWLTVSEAQENLAESYRFSDVVALTVNADLDLAVLKLQEDEFFTQSAVSKMVDDTDTLVTGDKCTVSGWPYGKSEWQIQNVTYMSIDDCIAAYSSLTTPINEELVCATPIEGNRSSCKENMGWPLFCNGELTGLFSWTYLSCEHPGVYSSMKVSAPWISEATASGVVDVATNVSVSTIILLLFYHVCRLIFL